MIQFCHFHSAAGNLFPMSQQTVLVCEGCHNIGPQTAWMAPDADRGGVGGKGAQRVSTVGLGSS